MFTGLIEEIGVVKSVQQSGDGRTITVACKTVMNGVQIGDSISIDGVCQTVTAFGADWFSVFASKITCEITTLGGTVAPGSKVNIERAMGAGERFGGHIVQGHVDGKGRIETIARDENGARIDISCSGDILKYIVAKGSVAVDGISLTVVSVNGKGFSLYLIPETIAKTTLNIKTKGSEVNIEADILAKYVEKMLGNRDNESKENKDIDLKRKLFENGFM